MESQRTLFASRNILTVSVLLYLLCASVSACFSSGWEFLFEDLLSDVCPILSSTTAKIRELFTSSDDEGPITSELISESCRCGRELAREARKRANKLVRSGVTLDQCSKTLMHFFSAALPSDIKKSSELSQDLISATKILQMKLCSTTDVTPNTFLSFLESHSVRPNELFCKPVKVTCSGSDRYRSIDGSCNNLQHPTWGRRGAPFTRITAPRYADGIYAMPVARSGLALPNARVLSTRLFSSWPLQSRVLSSFNMQWGQFVTHDLMFRVMEVTDEGGIECCLGNGRDILPQELQNDKCIPICVPEDDPFYKQYGVRCLNFVRSVTTPREDCSLGHAEQVNTVTSFLDGSPIYGSDPKTAAKLRSKSGGRLREEVGMSGFLPSVDDKAAVCDLRNMSNPCFFAGDSRINQTPTLAALHTIMLREHNRVADTLAALNPLWSDEKLFQEARRVVVAELQHITYQEWLPLNFGESYFRYYKISPSSLYSRDYNAEVNPGVISAVAAAALRFLHTIVPDTIMTCPVTSVSSTAQTAYLHKLSEHYFDPALAAGEGALAGVAAGLAAQGARAPGPRVSPQLSGLLFAGARWGHDLVAMDIQRGRDHGVAPYNDYREICGLKKAKTFQDLAGEISQEHINALASIYESVDDIDLFVGGALEKNVQGSILGHTFQCIIAEQFYRTRVGDRFFYDNSEMLHSFSPEQLKEIKKASLARLVCDNTALRRVQRRALELEGADNPRCACDDYGALPAVDLTPWKRPKYELYD